MELGSSPRVITSRKSIKYRQSSWSMHEFELWSGELVSRAVVMTAGGAFLVWVGGSGSPVLGEVALAVPNEAKSAIATSLLGGDGVATGLACRLASGLSRPVYVCCGSTFDRFTAPLLERGLITEIKSRPC